MQMEKKMEQDKEPTKEYEVSVVGKETQFKISVELSDKQFKRFVAFLMRK